VNVSQIVIAEASRASSRSSTPSGVKFPKAVELCGVAAQGSVLIRIDALRPLNLLAERLETPTARISRTATVSAAIVDDSLLAMTYTGHRHSRLVHRLRNMENPAQLLNRRQKIRQTICMKLIRRPFSNQKTL